MRGIGCHAKWLPELAFELAQQQPDVGVQLRVDGAQFLDLADRMNHGRVVSAPETTPDFRE